MSERGRLNSSPRLQQTLDFTTSDSRGLVNDAEGEGRDICASSSTKFLRSMGVSRLFG